MGRSGAAKSELEKYLDGLAVSLKIQAAKRPENWIKWIGLVVAIVVYFQVGMIPGLLALGAMFFLDIFLAKRRLKARTYGELLSRGFAEEAPRLVRQSLKAGKLGEVMGSEAQAILESMAKTANAVHTVGVEASMIEGGGLKVAKAFNPVAESVEKVMKAALHIAHRPVLVSQKPDAEVLAKLREYASNLELLLAEAEELRQEFRNPDAVVLEADQAMERHQARKELRESDDLRDGA